jgi:hypothetical protein
MEVSVTGQERVRIRSPSKKVRSDKGKAEAPLAARWLVWGARHGPTALGKRAEFGGELAGLQCGKNCGTTGPATLDRGSEEGC